MCKSLEYIFYGRSIYKKNSEGKQACLVENANKFGK